MGMLVSAAEAGALVGRHERMVRWHITTRRDLPAQKRQGQWQVNTDDLARVAGWVVDRERLARLELRQSRSAAGLVARVETLEQRLRATEARVRALEARLAVLNHARSDTTDTGDTRDTDAPEAELPALLPDWLTAFDVATETVSPPAYRGPSTVTLADRGPHVPRTFRTRADAARWLERHGVNALTPKSWPGWAQVELTPSGVLAVALERQRAARSASDWRVSWTLRRCEDAACVCQETLALAAGSMEPQPR